MTAFFGKRDRKVIPRWRSTTRMAATAEAVPLKTHLPAVSQAAGLLDSLTRDWQEKREIFVASDLVGAAFTLSRPDLAAVQDAAKFLIASGSKVPSSALSLAKEIVGAREKPEAAPFELPAPPVVDIVRVAIRSLKARVQRDPRNVVARVELARYYASIGQRDQSIGHMKIAVSLAAYHRHVIRAAARLFVHFNKIRDAEGVFRVKSAVRRDPWLVSAEIAVASVAGKSSSLIKVGREMLTSKSFAPKETSELASALGTLELEAGNTKAAKRLFQSALVDPTDNSIAQVEWASRRLGSSLLLPKHLDFPLTYEARALQGYQSQDWEASLESSRWWLADEPYSSRPAVLGSFVAAVGLEDHARAIELATIGLQANPNELALINNLAFSSASLGQFDVAEHHLEHLRSMPPTPQGNVLSLATTGLLRFRQGRLDEGNALYLAAITQAGETKQSLLGATATAFYVLEVTRAGLEVPPDMMAAAEVISKQLAVPGLSTVLERAKRAIVKKAKR